MSDFEGYDIPDEEFRAEEHPSGVTIYPDDEYAYKRIRLIEAQKSGKQITAWGEMNITCPHCYMEFPPGEHDLRWCQYRRKGVIEGQGLL